MTARQLAEPRVTVNGVSLTDSEARFVRMAVTLLITDIQRQSLTSLASRMESDGRRVMRLMDDTVT